MEAKVFWVSDSRLSPRSTQKLTKPAHRQGEACSTTSSWTTLRSRTSLPSRCKEVQKQMELFKGALQSVSRVLVHTIFDTNPLQLGEYDPAYAAVASSVAIPTWPVASPNRWNVLLEAVLFQGKTITPSTQVGNAPGNRAVVLLDSGTSYTFVSICRS
jgi:hypothetical protein